MHSVDSVAVHVVESHRNAKTMETAPANVYSALQRQTAAENLSVQTIFVMNHVHPQHLHLMVHGLIQKEITGQQIVLEQDV